MVLMDSATTVYFFKNQIIKQKRTREEFVHVSNPFFFVGKMSVIVDP